jgi:putative Holliday junction resolvase
VRILAIDYGRKRIGLALSDPLRIIAQPHGFLENNNEFSSKFLKLIQEQEISEIVVGLPRSMDGTESEMTREARAFADRLRKLSPLPIHLYDERLTSMQAERALIEGDMRREKRKLSRDAVAASLLLQAFLKTLTPTS